MQCTETEQRQITRKATSSGFTGIQRASCLSVILFQSTTTIRIYILPSFSSLFSSRKGVHLHDFLSFGNYPIGKYSLRTRMSQSLTCTYLLIFLIKTFRHRLRASLRVWMRRGAWHPRRDLMDKPDCYSEFSSYIERLFCSTIGFSVNDHQLEKRAYLCCRLFPT